SVERGISSWCGQLAGLNNDLAFLKFPRIFDKPALRRSRGARTVAVVHSAVTRTHEQTRLREPANRTSQMHAVDGKDLKLIALNAPAPTKRCRLSRLRLASNMDFEGWPAASRLPESPSRRPVAPRRDRHFPPHA